jgi:hypothetical protein
MYAENILSGVKSLKTFPDVLCIDKINKCEKWEDPALKKVEMKEEDMAFY